MLLLLPERSKKGTLTLSADPIAPSVQVDNLTVVNICFMESDTIAQWDREEEKQTSCKPSDKQKCQ